MQDTYNVGIYARLSRDDERTGESVSIENQKELLTQYVKEQGWNLYDYYCDEGITGTSAQKRPEFLRMIRKCRQKKIDLILTKSISRFARNTVDSLHYIRALKELGIAVIFEEQNINTLDSESEMLITMLSAFAQAESENISSNVRWGKRQAMREGRAIIQYKRLYALERGDDNKPKIIPEQAEVVRRIYRQYLAGASLRMIQNSLQAEQVPNAEGGSEWTITAIRGILTNEKYCGDVLMQKTFRSDCINRKVIRNTGQLPMYFIQDNHEGIVDRETYDAVQAELARRKAARSPSKKNSPTGLTSYASKYALSERLVCGECGTLYRRCTWSKNGRKRIVWRCVSRLDYGTKYCHDSPTLGEETLQRSILAAINSTMSRKSELISDIINAMRIELIPSRDSGLNLGEIERQIKAREREFQDLFDCMNDASDLSAHAEDFQRITDELAALKAEHARHMECQKKDTAAAWRLRKAADVLAESSGEITEWDERMIRQLVDTVMVLSANKLKITLRGGIEIEQDMLQ